LAPEYLAAGAVPKKRLSRDFRCLSIFGFFDSIDPTETSSVLFYGPSSLLVVCKGGGATAAFAARAERRS